MAGPDEEPLGEHHECQTAYEEMKANYEGACRTIAEMHMAAMGEIRGPGPTGVVGDIAALRMFAAQLAAVTLQARDCLSHFREYSDEANAEAQPVMDQLDAVLKPVETESNIMAEALWDVLVGSAVATIAGGAISRGDTGERFEVPEIRKPRSEGARTWRGGYIGRCDQCEKREALWRSGDRLLCAACGGRPVRDLSEARGDSGEG